MFIGILRDCTRSTVILSLVLWILIIPGIIVNTIRFKEVCEVGKCYEIIL